MIRSLESPLLRSAGFRAAFSLRGGDVSAVAEAIGVPVDDVRRCKQVHGSRALLVDRERDARAEEADALVTRDPSLAVAVAVADCVPVLVGDAKSGAVAAIHAGWRGVVGGVVPAAVAELARRAEASGGRFDLVAAIGPCIGPCCFEVGADVAEMIADAAPSERVIARRLGEKAYVDLRAAVRAQLGACGVDDARIEDVAGCTKHEPDRFHSFRRDGANAGRMIAGVRPRAQAAQAEQNATSS